MIDSNDGNMNKTNQNQRDFHILNYGMTQLTNGSYLHDDGDIHWYNEEGQLHKEDGPAVIWANGNSYWFLNGKHYDFYEWIKLTPVSDEHKLLLRLQYE
jgi:flagellar basal body rod protein FlgG